jgi:SWI/SNF-related matrix-associated actin-dependent regulator of chromatin subfamily A3
MRDGYLTEQQIFRAAVKLCGNMADLDGRLKSSEASPISGHTLLTITKLDGQFFVTFGDGAVLGEVNASLEQALASISEQQYTLDFEVFAPVRAIRETITKATKEKDAIVRVQISVYGPRSFADGVGQELSRQKVYLQSPDYVRPGTDYDNPHVLKLTDLQTPLPLNPTFADETATGKVADDDLKKTISNVYSSLTRDQNLRGLEGDERLRTPLLPWVILYGE